MSKRIKKCPYCGSKPKYETYYDFVTSFELYGLHCSNSKCSASPFTGYYDEKYQAKEAWNNSKYELIKSHSHVDLISIYGEDILNYVR